MNTVLDSKPSQRFPPVYEERLPCNKMGRWGCQKGNSVCDVRGGSRRTALLGGFGGEAKHAALETSQPAIIEMLKTAFYHDVIMQHIERDFADELSERYGEKYHKIIDYYNKEKGWNI